MIVYISDDDHDTYEVTSGFSHKQNRLNHEDMHLYGCQPDRDVFCVVTCNICGMILKASVFNNHIQKRHSGTFDSDTLIAVDEKTIDEADTVVPEPKAKRPRLNQNRNIESVPVGQTQSMMLARTQDFFQSNTIKSSQSFSHPQPIKIESQGILEKESSGIKMTLKKSGSLWSCSVASG